MYPRLSYVIIRDDLDLLIFLPRLPKCWDYMYVLPCPITMPSLHEYLVTNSVCPMMTAYPWGSASRPGFISQQTFTEHILCARALAEDER